MGASLALLLVSLLHVEGYTCPSGKSKETITLGVGESVDFSTQETDTYGKNVKCVQVQARKEEQVQAELLLLCIHSDRQELQLQQRQRLHEDRKREVSDVLGIPSEG